MTRQIYIFNFSNIVTVQKAVDPQDLVVNTTVDNRTYLSLMPNMIERN